MRGSDAAAEPANNLRQQARRDDISALAFVAGANVDAYIADMDVGRCDARQAQRGVTVQGVEMPSERTAVDIKHHGIAILDVDILGRRSDFDVRECCIRLHQFAVAIF